jgi:tRNA (uracil-5-)-methyltransferase TRM9
MKKETAWRLLSLNSAFYSIQAQSFSATRQRIQPGMARSVGEWMNAHGGFPASRDKHLLDLGCGNGNLAYWLAEQGFRGTYTGVEQSSGLLAAVNDLPENFKFHLVDLAQPDWLTEIPTRPFDLVTCFAVLHHLPGEGLRVRLLRELKRLLAPDGAFVLSVWQFMNSPRLVQRIQPWEEAGLVAGDVDAGDALLDWRAEGESAGAALRYVHAFTEEELGRLAEKSSLRIRDSWCSDGKDGCLGLYQIWSRA